MPEAFGRDAGPRCCFSRVRHATALRRASRQGGCTRGFGREARKYDTQLRGWAQEALSWGAAKITLALFVQSTTVFRFAVIAPYSARRFHSSLVHIQMVY